MKTKNIICFGFGQVAKNFIKKLNDEDIPFKLTTTSREESRNKKFENINYESFQFTESVSSDLETPTLLVDRSSGKAYTGHVDRLGNQQSTSQKYLNGLLNGKKN